MRYYFIFDFFYTLKEESKILNSALWSKLFRLFSKFSNEKNWKLIYRGSRDGFDAKDFHRECDDRAKTVTVIKTTNGNIFGGYTEKSWNSINSACSDTNAFIFSLVNKANKPFIAVSKHSIGFIGCKQDCGPIFGDVLRGGYDIFIASDSDANPKSHSHIGYSYLHHVRLSIWIRTSQNDSCRNSQISNN